MNEKAIQLYNRNTLEQNKAAKDKAIWGNPEMKAFRESIKAQFGLDIRDEKKFPVGQPGFSMAAFRRKVMREANTASANTQLLRAGVQTLVNNLYPAVKTTYEQWTHVVPSNKDTELYAPLNALTFPGELGEGERYLESSVVGLDLKIRNKKFGQMLPVSFELLEDDQTGQFQQKVGELADYAALVWEVYAYGKLAGLAGTATYGGMVVPASETKPSTESTYPWNSSGFAAGGGINKGTAAAMDVSHIQLAFQGLENMLNLQGLKQNVQPDKIIASPFYRFSLATILNSNFYPAGAAAAGVTGGSLAVNVLQGIADPVISRFVFDNNGACNNSKAWYVLDSSKPAFVVQIREAAKVTQENPESGAGFERDIYRWKLALRGNADFIDPRFFYQGSDGSA